MFKKIKADFFIDTNKRIWNNNEPSSLLYIKPKDKTDEEFKEELERKRALDTKLKETIQELTDSYKSLTWIEKLFARKRYKRLMKQVKKYGYIQ